MSGRSSEDILADLYARREEAVHTATIAQMTYLTQQITAHETLMRLEAEKAELDKEKADTMAVREQIRFWRAMADDDAGSAPILAPAASKPIDPAQLRPQRRRGTPTPTATPEQI